MGLLLPLVGFGIGLIGFGFFWMIMNDIIDNFIMDYVLFTQYFHLSQLMWDVLPWLTLITGVVCLILAGVIQRTTRTVIQE